MIRPAMLAVLVVIGGCSGRALEPACLSQCERTARTFEEAEACRLQCRRDPAT